MSDEQFRTTDFPVAAYLLTDGRVRLITVQALSPSRSQFVLAPKTLCDDLARDYHMDKALANPRVLHDRGRYLKNLIHSVRRGEF